MMHNLSDFVCFSQGTGSLIIDESESFGSSFIGELDAKL